MQHTIVESYSTGGGALVGTLAVTGDTELNSDIVLAASSTNVEADIAFTLANVKSMALMCTADATVKTNDSGSPQETISLSAGIPLVLQSQTEAAATFAGDVTQIFLTCSAGGTFSSRILLDQTP